VGNEEVDEETEIRMWRHWVSSGYGNGVTNCNDEDAGEKDAANFTSRDFYDEDLRGPKSQKGDMGVRQRAKARTKRGLSCGCGGGRGANGG